MVPNSKSKGFTALEVFGGEGGLTLLELIVAVLVITATLGAAIPRFTASMRNADSAASALIANLRLCRTQAISGGYHYRINVTSTSTYDVQKMLPPVSGSTWVVDTGTATRTVTLPTTVRFTVGSGSYEFDTRGTTIGATAVANLTLHDSAQNRDAVVQVWPSGQVDLQSSEG